MASARELKDRIKAVRETKKITGAMYLISSTKLRRAREEYAETKPYFDALRAEAERILRAGGDDPGRRFAGVDGSPPQGGVCGVVVVTADKGLAGAYNQSVLHEAEALLAEKPGARIFVIGEYGRRYYAQHGMDADWLSPAHSPTAAHARELCAALLDRYDGGELNELYAVYTDVKNAAVSVPVRQRLLPLERRGADPEGDEPAFEYLPSEAEVLDGAVRSFLGGFLYGALLDSYCAEQNARVAAMDAANTNAQELLGALSLQLNRTRQGAITREITEISAGAQAQRQKQEEKRGGGA